MNYRSYKILYVDDEPANLTTFRYCFDEQFEVLTATSAEEALGILARQPIAVLLADQRMPGMSGAELCQLVRERHPDVVRMILTAYADISAAAAAINGGQVSRYLFKPWREEALTEVLRTGVDAYQLGMTTRDVQARLLRQDQQATATYLLGRVLHELSNPAASLNTNVEWIADSVMGLTRRSDLPPPLLAELVEIQTAAREARAASRELIQRIERFRSGDQPAPPSAGTDLKRAVEAALTIVDRQLRKQAELVVTIEGEPTVAADATQISQIVINLLLNAADAVQTKADGERRIGLRLSTELDQALIEVSDTGEGIAPELMERVFEPFVTTRSQEVPRGFGLAIVREIVDGLGGVVRVTSAVGQGSSFTVMLPLVKAR